MTKDELIKKLGLFCEANPPLEYEMLDNGERIDVAIMDEKEQLVSDAFYITHTILEDEAMEKLLEARLSETKRAYKEMLNE